MAKTQPCFEIYYETKKLKGSLDRPHSFWGWFIIRLARLDTVFLCTKFVIRRLGMATIILYTKYKVYVYSLRRYERQWKVQNFGWFGEVAVCKGHRQHNHSIECIRLPIQLYRNYVSILYHFRVIAIYSSKVAEFNIPTCIWSPYWGWSHWNFVMIFGIKKLRVHGI